jgi:hypothetical protein
VRLSTVLILLVLVGAPAAWLLVSGRDLAENERRVSAIASEIAGRSVTVKCPGVFASLVDVSWNSGSVRFDANGRPADEMKLSGETCSFLEDFAEGRTDAGDESKVARALHVLMHESFHLVGIRNEAAADCYAFQRVELAATRLGAEPVEAQALAARAYVDRQETAPPDYRSSECRDGGALDLSPAPRWP